MLLSSMSLLVAEVCVQYTCGSFFPLCCHIERVITISMGINQLTFKGRRTHLPTLTCNLPLAEN